MKRILLAGVCAAGMMGMHVRHARAQIPVTDVGAIANLVTQVRQSLQQIQLMQSQLQQVMAVYNSISGVRNLGGALSAASTLGLTNNMPINPFAVQSLLNGTGHVDGALGSIGSLFNGNYAQNHIYDCTGNSFECQRLQRNATSIAGQQGLAGELYHEMTNHIQALQGLQTRLNGATNLQDVAYVNGQIADQQAAIQNLQAQTQALSVMQQAAIQSQQQQQEEKRQQDIDAVMAANPYKLP